MTKILFTLAALTAIAVLYCPDSYAKMAASPGCGMVENASVSVSFNGTEQDISVVKGKFDSRIEDIKKLAKEMGLEKFDIQSMSYSINPQNYNSINPQYSFSGNASFTILPAGKATDFMVALTKKGYQASLNVNSYHNGNPCAGNIEGSITMPRFSPPAS